MKINIRRGSYDSENQRSGNRISTITGGSSISNNVRLLNSVKLDSDDSSRRHSSNRRTFRFDNAGSADNGRNSNGSGGGNIHDSGTQEGRMAEIVEHLSRTWSRLNRPERRRIGRRLMSGDFQPHKLVNKKLMALGIAPVLLAGCDAASAVKEQGEGFLTAAAETTKAFIDGSMSGWYGFIGQLYGTMIDVILKTPEYLISNSETQRLWLVFVGVSMAFLSSLVIIESFRIMFGKSKTNLMSMIGRTGVSFFALSFILPAMTMGLWFINELVSYFVAIAHNNLNPADYFGDTLSQSFANGGINFLASIVFIVLFLLYIFKVLLYYGRRWFDIMVAAIISPLAFAANIFDSTSQYFSKWWTHILQLYVVQVVHAVYVMVLGIIVLSPGEIKGAGDAFFRILLLIGALWRMSEPPQFVQPMADGQGPDMFKAITNKIPLNKLRQVFKK